MQWWCVSKVIIVFSFLYNVIIDVFSDTFCFTPGHVHYRHEFQAWKQSWACSDNYIRYVYLFWLLKMSNFSIDNYHAGCIGAVLVLFSLSTVCIIIHESLSLQQKSFRKKVDHLNDFIRRKRIPDPLAARVCLFVREQCIKTCLYVGHLHASSTKSRWINLFNVYAMHSCYE